jgi:two-component system NarL family sensor kinase
MSGQYFINPRKYPIQSVVLPIERLYIVLFDYDHIRTRKIWLKYKPKTCKPMTFRTKLLAITILPVVLISLAALILIDSQSRKLAEAQGKAVENMIFQSKKIELQNYIKLARAAVEPFYQWDNVSRLQAQKQVADVITRMNFDKDGYFFISMTNGDVLQNPLLGELEGRELLTTFGDEASKLAESFDDITRKNGSLYQYSWIKPSTGKTAEKLGQSVYLDNWDWVIGSGLYLDDVNAQIGAIQKELDTSVQQTRFLIIVFAIGAVALTSILLAFVRFSEQRFADARLKELATEIVNAQENERKRVSTDLHDGISQLLVSARYGLDVALAKASKYPAIQAPINKSMETILTAISEIRRISIALRPSILDDVGLAAAVKSLGSDFQQQTNIETNVEAENVGDLLNDREKTSLYRIAQEALANVAKYASANTVTISLKKEGNNIAMIIQDNGKGLPTEWSTTPSSGMGLRNMKERIASHKGTFKLTSLQPKGVKLEVYLKAKTSKGK